MRRLKAIAVVLWVLGIGAAPRGALAAPFDGSVPILCAPATIMECGSDGACQRSTLETANVPPFVKADLKTMQISTLDGKRTSPIKHMDRLDGKIILHGGEGGRGWSVVITEANGKMSGAVSAEAHGFLIFGSCTPL